MFLRVNQASEECAIPRARLWQAGTAYLYLTATPLQLLCRILTFLVEAYGDAALVEKSLGLLNGKGTEVKNRSGQHGVGSAVGEGLAQVGKGACASRGDDGDGDALSQRLQQRAVRLPRPRRARPGLSACARRG
jgi:hypothetical protein